MSCTHAYTLTDPQIAESPFDFYGWMHAHAPVYFDPGLKMYIVASYDLIRQVALNTSVFSNEQAQLNQWDLRPGGLPPKARAILDAATPQVPMLVTADPPRHRRSRTLVQLAFTQKRVERMRLYITRIVDELITGFHADGKVELVGQFAVALPVRVISDLLGVPQDHAHQVKIWSDAVVGLRGLMGSDAEIIGYAESLARFQAFFTALMAARRARGARQDDLLDDLLNAQATDEDPMDHAELLSVIQQIMVAGNESTTSAIVSGMAILLRHPDEMKKVVGDANRMRRFVEEVLRLEPPVQGNLRRTTAAVTLAGVAIPQGALVQLRHGAGNRDGSAFACPNAMDLDAISVKPHLAFGYGLHLCIGNALAREEMSTAFFALLTRLENLRAEPDANDFLHGRSIYLRGLRKLNLAFVPGSTRHASVSS